MTDLLLRGGYVVDPSQGIDALMDVAVIDGRIAEVAPEISVGAAAQVIDDQGDRHLVAQREPALPARNLNPGAA